ncbi:uncharacterized protein LOC129607975 [Condylostylus longicornis]|uniref:uncharacterized protein LOC129607975 n=1 Tax=Condylostylus longicornis TaxID=2530218 RepID=UPI00244E49BA|nr:uncharacterized protein LOC129607975 [Condylostylus longicornis]
MDKRNQLTLGTICDGEIEISLLREDDVEEALEVLKKSFFINENLCIATDVNKPENENAIDELTELAKQITKDGISVIARHIPSNKIAGVALNKIHKFCPDKKSTQGEFLENFLDSTCKTENVKCITKSLETMEEKFNIFIEWDIDCIVEHFMLSVLTEFGKRNIGYNLSLYSIQLAMELNQNTESIIREFLPIHLQNCHPKAIYAIFTSKYSHKIGQRLGFEDLAIVPYTEFFYKGQKFSDKLDPIHENCILGAKKF